MLVWEYAFCALLLLHIAFTLLAACGWWRLVHRPQVPLPAQWPAISVVVALRNEGPRVAACLTRILQQAYPTFEVIAISDQSTDDTLPQLQVLAAKHPKLKILHIEALPPGWSGKKHATATGVAAAQYNCFAFTDADCDVPKGWLEALAAPLAAGKQVVLGYSPFYSAPGLANIFSRYDTLAVAAQYLGWAAAGLPYMAVGRNLAYTRAFWERSGGHAWHAATPSGDDDIAINRYARADEIGLLTAANTHVYSFSPPSLGAWVRQKVRHLGAASHYTWSSKLLLGLAAAAQHLTLPALLVICGASGLVWQWVSLWAAAYLVQAAMLYMAMRVLAQRALPPFSLFYMPFLQTLLYVVVGIRRAILGGRVRWK